MIGIWNKTGEYILDLIFEIVWYNKLQLVLLAYKVVAILLGIAYIILCQILIIIHANILGDLKKQFTEQEMVHLQLN